MVVPHLAAVVAKVFKQDGFASADGAKAFVDGLVGHLAVAAGYCPKGEAGGAEEAVVGVEGRCAGVRNEGEDDAEHLGGLLGW